jgi:hypothetical protein
MEFSFFVCLRPAVLRAMRTEIEENDDVHNVTVAH